MRATIRLIKESDVPRVLQIHKDSFAGAPWFEELSEDDLQRRWTTLENQFKFDGLVAEFENKIVGVHLWYFISPQALARDRGQGLVDWLKCEIDLTNQRKDNDSKIVLGELPIVWEAELMVDPNFQRQGIATFLRQKFIERIQAGLHQGIILSRIRDDNIGSIKTAKKNWLRRTGVQKPSSEKPKMHEYWYLKVNF